jgi:hypothetical protein
MSTSRIVCHFSCGAASAVATKLILAEQPDDVLILNAFITEEHPDNRRFLADCEHWFGRAVTVVRNEKYNSSTHEVWRMKRYIKGMYGAPCSLALKRDLLLKSSKPDDVNVMGYTAEEPDRAESMQELHPLATYRFPLIEKCVTKEDCLAIVERAGIELPVMYRLGYRNANCIGCCKGGIGYWQAIRSDFPRQFAEIQGIQETIGAGANFLRFRSGERAGERMGLRDLPEGGGDRRDGPPECGLFCEAAERDMEETV